MCPDSRVHRGPHPKDREFFSDRQIPILRQATEELSWLLSHGYNLSSSLKLVGDRHKLHERQRAAISRAAGSNEANARRRNHCVEIRQVESSSVNIDGFNLIITIEAALSGAPLLVCRDECIRDLSSVHGSYRSVLETESALLLVGEVFEELRPGSVRWLLDRPVSNSGRLAQKIINLSKSRSLPWNVEVVYNPDAEIIASSAIAVSSDSTILDRVERWANLNAYLVQDRLKDSWLIDLRS